MLGGELARPGKKRWATCCWTAQKEKEKKNKEAVGSSLTGEMSVALPVVGEKGGGGGFYRWPKAAGVD
jgi:hypothetical protein